MASLQVSLGTSKMSARHTAVTSAPRLRACARKPVVARAQYDSNGRRGDGFWTGFAIGGALFGAAGFFFAPQISRAILTEQQKLRVPKWMEEEDKPPVTKAELEEKISQLHNAINDVASQVTPGSNTASNSVAVGSKSK